MTTPKTTRPTRAVGRKKVEAWAWFYCGRPIEDPFHATEAEARKEAHRYGEKPDGTGDYLVHLVEASPDTEAELRAAKAEIRKLRKLEKLAETVLVQTSVGVDGVIHDNTATIGVGVFVGLKHALAALSKRGGK